MAFFLLAGLVTGSIFAYTLVPLTQLSEFERCNSNAVADFNCTQHNSLTRLTHLDV